MKKSENMRFSALSFLDFDRLRRTTGGELRGRQPAEQRGRISVAGSYDGSPCKRCGGVFGGGSGSKCTAHMP